MAHSLIDLSTRFTFEHCTNIVIGRQKSVIEQTVEERGEIPTIPEVSHGVDTNSNTNGDGLVNRDGDRNPVRDGGDLRKVKIARGRKWIIDGVDMVHNVIEAMEGDGFNKTNVTQFTRDASRLLRRHFSFNAKSRLRMENRIRGRLNYEKSLPLRREFKQLKLQRELEKHTASSVVRGEIMEKIRLVRTIGGWQLAREASCVPNKGTCIHRVDEPCSSFTDNDSAVADTLDALSNQSISVKSEY